jgi:CheY-like chemotaxis protein
MLHRLLREDVEMVVESEPDLWLTRIDPNQIDRVLLNLAVNACDAMPKGGKLRIGLRNVQLDGRAPELQETDLPAGDYVELTVSDSGVGIPPDVLPRIFEPFFTTKPVGAGTGLGLAMCYGVVKQANGTIRVTSRPGAGTTFTVLLPRTEASSPETVVEGEADAFPGGTETVLVVEDNDMVRGMASRALRGAGYHVLQAEDGEAALECAERYAGEIHLLLADVVMPGLSGPELAEQLMAVRPGTRILFMSGYTEETAVRRGIEEGKATFIAKPFTPAAIARAVRAALDGKSV